MKLNQLCFITSLAAAFLAGGLAVATSRGPSAKRVYLDVPEDHWAAGALHELKQKEIFVGYPDGTFRGGRPLSRHEASIMISQTLKYVDKHYMRKPSESASEQEGRKVSFDNRLNNASPPVSLETR